MKLLESLNGYISGDMIETVLLIMVVLSARVLIVKALRRNMNGDRQIRRRWISLVQNTSVVLLLFGLAFIWSPELSAFALSIAAFSVALVIATKESILCLIGAVHRAVTRPFAAGDWIEVDGQMGEVISEGLLATQIQEIDPHRNDYRFTGAILTVPNSKLLTTTVRNRSFAANYVYHAFTVTMKPAGDPFAVREEIEARLQHHCRHFEEVGRRYWSLLTRKFDAALPDPAPALRIGTTNLGDIVFDVSVFCPVGEAVALEQAMMADIMAVYGGTVRAGQAVPDPAQGQPPAGGEPRISARQGAPSAGK
ncbi:MAG: mechanosensitive ion channel family protein [Alphaproteobacteria bacterium]